MKTHIPIPPILQRIFRRVYRPLASGCWIWTGATVGNERRRYGIISYQGRAVNVRRLVYTLTRSRSTRPLLEDYEIDSTCLNSLCINPDHLVRSRRRKGGRKGVV